MEAIILAAGVGRRLYPLTKDRPKCMLEIGGEPLLSQIIENIKGAGIGKILVVTGHRAEAVGDLLNTFPDGNISILYNSHYTEMNNCYSLWLALQEVADDCLIYNSDLFCGPTLVRRIVEASPRDVLLIDEGKALGKEEMKVRLNEDQQISQISKEIPPSQANGEYIGIAKFSRQGAEKLKGRLDHLIKEGKVDQFYEAGIDLLAQNYPLYGVRFRGEPWVEIDDFADLEKARGQIWPQLKEN